MSRREGEGCARHAGVGMKGMEKDGCMQYIYI